MSWLSRKSAAPEESFLHSVRVAGTRVAYYERGQGPALLLVHGMFGDHQDWAPVLERLSRNFRVIAIDLPGFGGSERPLESCAMEFFLEALQGVVSALGLSDVILVGNSFGGMIAAHFADRHPEWLRALVLVSSAGMREYSAVEQAIAASRFTEANLRLLRPEYLEALFGPVFARRSPARKAYMEHQRRKLEWPDYAEYAHVLAACAPLVFARPIVPMLRQMMIPVLLLWGSEDSVFPVTLAENACATAPLARLAVVPGAGHMPQIDEPGGFCERLESFVRSLCSL